MMKTISVLVSLFAFVSLGQPLAADQFNLRLRCQKETGGEPDRFQRFERAENWDASQTAVIVCDVCSSVTEVTKSGTSSNIAKFAT